MADALCAAGLWGVAVSQHDLTGAGGSHAEHSGDATSLRGHEFQKEAIIKSPTPLNMAGSLSK